LPEDIMPMHLQFSTSHLVADLDCMLWSLEDNVITGSVTIEFPITQSPTCGLDGESEQFTPAGLMALVNGAPGVDEAILLDGNAVTPTINCKEEITIPIPTTACAVEFDPAMVIIPDTCSHALSAQSNVSEPLPPGVREIAIGVSDAWGNSTLCKTTVTVVDIMPPSVFCPMEAVETQPDEPLILTAQVTDPCQTTTVIDSIECLNNQGEAFECTAMQDGVSIRFETLPPHVSNINWTVRAEDSAGNAVSHNCETPIIQPPVPKPEAESTGCQTAESSEHRRRPWAVGWALLLLAWCGRRMICAENRSAAKATTRS